MSGTHPGVPGSRDRLRGAIGALAVQGLLGLLLLSGLAGKSGTVESPAMRMLDFTLPPPPPTPEPQAKPARSHRPEGAAAPPNLKSRATEVTSPVPAPIPTPQIIVAPIAASGSEASSGNAPVAGPGTGAGGAGNGTGSGGAGDGDGDGGTPLEWIGGRIRDSDYPRAALRAGISGTVHLRFTVGVKGRVTDCTVTRSSGNRDLDETTCRLIQQRFRYKPSRDANGRPYPDTVTGDHEWTLWRRADDSDD
ncbi:energy transducer TonB [Sphingomonas sp. JC676]|uniref:energy transducer TonB n=1 Tax=Sphingomonas sp. JC676 TaxID=2768065 RepID=UPI0016581F1C|nr:energy transducer TonB [Sphingomonas sp. JC676]MBC9034029.1 energy transducer TonB [Sphingomonas sp. JC676]